MKTLFNLAITTGDLDGVGLEVTSKALMRLKPQKGIQIYLWRGQGQPRADLNRIDRYFKRKTVTSWPEAMRTPPDYYKTIIEIESPLSPARWVETMARAGMSGSIDALVTAPLSKTEIKRSGLKDNGHTGILKRITKTPDIFMSFLGKDFSVTLATGHISIKKAYDRIDKDLIVRATELTHKLIRHLPKRERTKPLALVGCNPHAGEEGLIDKKETLVYGPALKALRLKRIQVTGPLVPDVCFQENERKKYSFFIASYHDQGLIPFKMIHGASTGIQYSLGLPFIRTSVDHGTAKDIFGKNKADYGSMENALIIAVNLLKNKPIKW